MPYDLKKSLFHLSSQIKGFKKSPIILAEIKLYPMFLFVFIIAKVSLYELRSDTFCIDKSNIFYYSNTFSLDFYRDKLVFYQEK